MTPRRLLLPSALLALLLGGGLATAPARAADREIGGYVAQAEDRFVRNVWNFVKHFQSWQNIGGHRYRNDQYYWMEPWLFDSAHASYVDSQDVAYVACHGTEWRMCSHGGTVDVDLRDVPGYGDLNNGGDMEFLIVESCDTITSFPEPSFDWNGWRHTSDGGVFDGLHQAMGFRTLSYSDNKIPSFFASQVKGNNVVWQAWFTAVQLERIFPTYVASPGPGIPYPGWASAVMAHQNRTDRLGAYGPDPEASDTLYNVWEN